MLPRPAATGRGARACHRDPEKRFGRVEVLGEVVAEGLSKGGAMQTVAVPTLERAPTLEQHARDEGVGQHLEVRPGALEVGQRGAAAAAVSLGDLEPAHPLLALAVVVLVALDAGTGKQLWEHEASNALGGEGGFLSATLVYDNYALLAPATSEMGVNGWIGAFRETQLLAH